MILGYCYDIAQSQYIRIKQSIHEGAVWWSREARLLLLQRSHRRQIIYQSLYVNIFPTPNTLQIVVDSAVT